MLRRAHRFPRCRVVALTAVALAISTVKAAESRDPRWVDDQLLIRRGSAADEAAREALAAEEAATVADIPALGVSVVELPHGRRGEAQRRLRASRLFRSVERNYVAQASEVPDDPLYPGQWALPRVQASLAWDLTHGLGVTIAIVDSGVDAQHPDLAPQLVPGFNAIDNSTNTADDNGHGTRMSGIAAARGFDGFGVCGLAPDARLMPIKSLGSSGQGTYADVAQGIVYAVDHGAQVISLSLGGQVPSSTLATAVNYAVSHSVVIVAAAGNDGSGAPNYPAGYADAVAVGASDSADTRASFSNYGSWVDLVAPGVGISTTNMGGGFTTSTGTSPATPLVAATAALMLSVNPSLQPSQVASILTMTSADTGQPGFDDYDGWGRLDAGAAVAQASALAAEPDSAAPSVAVTAPGDGADVSGVVSLEVSASDDVAVSRVEYTVDGVVVAGASEVPFAAAWDTATTVAGPHVLRAAAYDASGNHALSAPVTFTVGGNQVGCDSQGWSCLPGAGTARTDCFSEWLVRSDTVLSEPRQKGRVSCRDGSSCDADGVADGVCRFTLGLCFAVADPRLVDRQGAPACNVDDLTAFQLLSPGFRRAAIDSVDRSNAQSLLTTVAALASGQMEGRCAAGVKGRSCSVDSACDSSPGSGDGVCGLERTSLAGIGGVQTCTATQSIAVPLRGTGTRRRRGVRALKTSISALTETGRQPRDSDALTLECLP